MARWSSGGDPAPRPQPQHRDHRSGECGEHSQHRERVTDLTSHARILTVTIQKRQRAVPA
nr:hypothetical protein GCM10020092_003660 [Actinoplanes digitatis]